MNLWIATYVFYGDDWMYDTKPSVLGIFKTEAEAREAVKKAINDQMDEPYDENGEKPYYVDYEKMSMSHRDYDYNYEWNVEEVEVK